MKRDRLGHYDIVCELGRGGMGVVYKGYEPSLNRHVAIKVLAESLAHDPAVKERFLREARSMAALNDAHIIQIHFIGEDEGQTYFVMEFVDGESLGVILEREVKLSPEQAARIVYQTAQGLAAAHDKGVVHRDIKPGNLMIASRGMVKIADFGIALSTQDFSRKLTSTGEFVGTPGYLSPEVCLGTTVDQRSDIFSLGIVLFECLAGRMPFTDQSPLGLMLEVVKAEIPDVRALNADVDAELSRILGKMIAKEPGERYQDSHELVADLERHPLIAKGGALQFVQLAKRPDKPVATSLAVAPGVAKAAAAAVDANASTARRAIPRPMMASGPMLARTPAQAARRSLSRSQWAACASGLVLIAASVWAYRDDLPFLRAPARLETNGPANLAAVPPLPRTTMKGDQPTAFAKPDGSDSATPKVDTHSAAGAAMQASASDEARVSDASLDDLSIDDLLHGVPDGMRSSNAQGTAAYPHAAYRGPYSYPPALLPVGFAPVAYAPVWHVGFGIGFWSGYLVPRPAYVGPVLRPIVWPRPSPVMPVAIAASNPAAPNRPVPPPPAPRAGPAAGAVGPLGRAPAAQTLMGHAAELASPSEAPAPYKASTSMAQSVPVAHATAPAVRTAAQPAPRMAHSQPAREQGPAAGNGVQPFRPGQPRGEARMAQNPQRREAFLANQNARRVALAEERAAQARAHAAQQARVKAAHERKPKAKQPRRRPPGG